MKTEAMPVSVYDLYLSFMSSSQESTLAAEGSHKVDKDQERSHEGLHCLVSRVYLGRPAEQSEVDDGYDEPAHHKDNHNVPEKEVFELPDLREVLREPEDDGLFAIFIVRELPV